MMIKLNTPKNVYGKRVLKGAVLAVGKDIPEWQAKVFLDLSIADETKPEKKAKKNKADNPVDEVK